MLYFCYYYYCYDCYRRLSSAALHSCPPFLLRHVVFQRL